MVPAAGLQVKLPLYLFLDLKILSYLTSIRDVPQRRHLFLSSYFKCGLFQLFLLRLFRTYFLNIETLLQVKSVFFCSRRTHIGSTNTFWSHKLLERTSH